jgi:hypothetical protein
MRNRLESQAAYFWKRSAGTVELHHLRQHEQPGNYRSRQKLTWPACRVCPRFTGTARIYRGLRLCRQHLATGYSSRSNSSQDRVDAFCVDYLGGSRTAFQNFQAFTGAYYWGPWSKRPYDSCGIASGFNHVAGAVQEAERQYIATHRNSGFAVACN